VKREFKRRDKGEEKRVKEGIRNIKEEGLIKKCENAT
jgi:MoaA/NifB/PqqE/SkfB family radical SAM enzyme